MAPSVPSSGCSSWALRLARKLSRQQPASGARSPSLSPTWTWLRDRSVLCRRAAPRRRALALPVTRRHRPSSQGYGVLAISVAGTGPATAVEIPRRCLRRRRSGVTKELLLARSAEGRLALLVAESLGIAMWTLSSDDGSSSWARRVVVDRERILGSAKLHCHPLGCVGTELEWFAEASGTVLFQVNGAGIFLLNLHTGEISQFSKGRSIRRSLRCCPFLAPQPHIPACHLPALLRLLPRNHLTLLLLSSAKHRHAHARSLLAASALHALAVASRHLPSDLRLANSLLSLYLSLDSPTSARRLLTDIPRPDTVT
ncbi:hypothetical protein BAE44_0005595 [Dichanthelium oligosanthes]|uniref:DUF7595 domain-containing protein n=1 Tax=Dichanthelium oligosanthes TaxID=888268 RepID=A0A1E5W7M6_9POAL|nr:hypothetical protein BAE44_0005595 [Dichanthelium oligosanthes]